MDNDLQNKNKIKIQHCFIIFLLLFLSACHTKVRRDGPPNFYVDETRIPNATPKPEPLAKYGNMPSYRVFGKRYYTLHTSKHYEAYGTASWYGTMFHTHKTSSGEPYNMLGMTAAHKTLPLPTYVEVTNLVNNKKIIVKVNDRGPFESNRLIDLSYVAAKKLGMLGHGTTQVHIKAIDPYTYGRPILLATKIKHGIQHFQSSFSSTRHTNDVYLQVGAFKMRSNAEQLQLRLANLLETPVQIMHPNAKGKLYRVQVGPVRDTASANRITSQLKTLGIKPNKTAGA